MAETSRLEIRSTWLAVLAFVGLLVGCGDSGTAPENSSASAPSAPGQAPLPGNLPPALQAIANQGQQAQTELQQVAGRLSSIQEQALQADHIVALQEELQAAAEAAILKESPDAEAALKRLPELVKLLESNTEIAQGNADNFSDETKALITEYETLTNEIQPIQAKVAALPEITEGREKLFETIHTESMRIDPEFESLEQKYDELNLKLQELQQKYMAAQQQNQPQVPGNIAVPMTGPPPASLTQQPPIETQPSEQAAEASTEE